MSCKGESQEGTHLPHALGTCIPSFQESLETRKDTQTFSETPGQALRGNESSVDKERRFPGMGRRSQAQGRSGCFRTQRSSFISLTWSRRAGLRNSANTGLSPLRWELPQVELCLSSDWGSLRAGLCLPLRLGPLRAELCLSLRLGVV